MEATKRNELNQFLQHAGRIAQEYKQVHPAATEDEVVDFTMRTVRPDITPSLADQIIDAQIKKIIEEEAPSGPQG